MSRSERFIGIALGLIVGVAALILFIFFGSEGAIDDPSLNTTAPPAQTDQGGRP